MARAADPGSAGGAPFAKFVDLDDTLVGAFGSAPRECKRQVRNYDTGNPAVKDDGTPRWEEVMHFIAMPGTTAKTGSADEGFEPITEGDEVRFSVQGFRWGQVIDQRKQEGPSMRGSWLTFTAAVVAITVTACGGTAGSDTSPARTPDRTVFCNAAYEYGRRTQVQDDPAVTQELWNEQAEYIKTANGSVPDDLADDWALVLTAGETSRTNLANNQWNLIPGDPAPNPAFDAAEKAIYTRCSPDIVIHFQRQ